MASTLTSNCREKATTIMTNHPDDLGLQVDDGIGVGIGISSPTLY